MTDTRDEARARFENVARCYLNGSKLVQDIILSFFDGEEKRIFLEAVGFYHLFNDKEYYKIVRDELARQIWEASNLEKLDEN